jgi:uncharacterized protein (TIGR03067 family)
MQRILPFLCLCMGLASAQAQSKEETLKAEWKKLTGTWSVSDARKGEVELPKGVRELLVFEIAADSIRVTMNKETTNGKMSIDPAKSPPTFDMTMKKDKESTSLGIYKIDGDTLILCMSESGKRPTEFKAGDAQTFIMKLTRVKN